MADNLTERLESCYTGAVFDVMWDLGFPNGLLPRELKSLDPEKTVAGPVFPVLGRPDSSLTPDESLLRWTEFLGTVPAGHVVACQPQDDDRALMGELSAETLQFRGVRGYIVDGGCRDVSFIKALGFPVFCRFTTPRDIVAAWTPEAYNVPIQIGEVDPSRRLYTRRPGRDCYPSRNPSRGHCESGRGGGANRKPRPQSHPRRHAPQGGGPAIPEVLKGLDCLSALSYAPGAKFDSLQR